MADEASGVMTQPKSSNRDQLTGHQKAAILLISLGSDLAARVLRHFDEEEIERVTYDIATMEHIPVEVRDSVLEEFASIAIAQKYVSQGGTEYARRILEEAVGNQRAMDIMSRLTTSMQTRPFELLRRMDPEQLLNFLQGEHPQTIALIISYLAPEQAAEVLQTMPEETQVDVSRRLALMDRTSPGILEEMEELLESKFSSLMLQDYTKTGGVDSLVEILNRIDRSSEKTILGRLEDYDQELAEEVRKKMFTFDDIAVLDDRAIQRVLREIDLQNDLPMALKATGPEVKEKILSNLSSRAAETVLEDMEYLGPVRLSSVEEAQQSIVSVVRKLDEAGEIVVVRGWEDNLVT
ncbi:MAG: flagellar motor switch protein FliG [Bacillota bacterium]